jgi:hypothetical protein
VQCGAQCFSLCLSSATDTSNVSCYHTTHHHYYYTTLLLYRMVLHCHIAQHSDLGVIAVMNIVGLGDDAISPPTIVDFGTCKEVLPASTPFAATPAAIPGVVQAEDFDNGGEGIGYHNINIDTNVAPVARQTEAVELRSTDAAVWVSTIRKGEWLKYSVAVGQAGYYTMTMNTGALAAAPLKFSVWQNVAECPAPGIVDGLIGRVDIASYAGSGTVPTPLESFLVPAPFNFALLGDITMTVCWEADAALSLDSYVFQYCGATAADCTAIPGQTPADTPVAPAARQQGSSAARSFGVSAAATSLLAALIVALMW